MEVIEDGPNRSNFHVDFSLLAEQTGDPKLAVCLTKTFASYTEAVAAEVKWIEENWLIT